MLAFDAGMSEAMALSVSVSGVSRLFGAGPGALLEAARIADDAGIDQLAFPDHLAIGPRSDRYPYGRFPFGPDEPWLEPVTALAAVAAVTRRLRIATSVLVAPLRPAEDAIVVDTTDLNIEQVVERVLAVIAEKTGVTPPAD